MSALCTSPPLTSKIEKKKLKRSLFKTKTGDVKSSRLKKKKAAATAAAESACGGDGATAVYEPFECAICACYCKGPVTVSACERRERTQRGRTRNKKSKVDIFSPPSLSFPKNDFKKCCS